MFTIWAHRPAIAETTRPAPSRFAPAEVARGRGLAAIGNCATCHTTRAGPAYAGGRAIATPFGTLYGPNITPDPETGIGRWSLAAFARALREGVGRDGRHLYPALPYDHFARLSDADVAALYAYLMTRRAVRAEVPANRLIPPLGFRPLLAAWKVLFLPLAPVPTTGSGAYLAEGLAHCGSCHRPRNLFGAERGSGYPGGFSDGWYAPALDAGSPAVRAWTAERLYIYLRTGLSAHHAAAAGPMGAVAGNLSRAPEADVRAIAEHYAGLMGDAPAARREPALPDRRTAAGAAHPEGATIFAGACASCHEAGAAMMHAGRPALALGTPLHEDNPRDTIQIILQGLEPPVGSHGPAMPAYADTLTDAQVAAIVVYMRARFGPPAPWRNPAADVARARREGSR